MPFTCICNEEFTAGDPELTQQFENNTDRNPVILNPNADMCPASIGDTEPVIFNIWLIKANAETKTKRVFSTPFQNRVHKQKNQAAHQPALCNLDADIKHFKELVKNKIPVPLWCVDLFFFYDYICTEEERVACRNSYNRTNPFCSRKLSVACCSGLWVSAKCSHHFCFYSL